MPFVQWPSVCSRLEEVPRGLSRHFVVFVNYAGVLYAIKELPLHVAAKEYHLLLKMETRVPTVKPVGYVCTHTTFGKGEALITRYLSHSVPFRNLFANRQMERYREHLLDAITSLMVQLHLAGIFWGDCSLSNSLFRRDAGALRAYLVDAETAELHPDDFSPVLRHHDLEIMEENVNGDLALLATEGSLEQTYPVNAAGTYIRQRYQRLWEEITHEDIINPDEHYRIQERIRALNTLGYSVGDVELLRTQSGDQLRLRAVVTDQNFHRDLLLNLAGLAVEERQAQKMMNEIQELKATLSRQNNHSTPLSVAAYHWLKHIYLPTLKILDPIIKGDLDQAELYCQVLEHKWFLSERAQRDVGHDTAAHDYLDHFAGQLPGLRD